MDDMTFRASVEICGCKSSGTILLYCMKVTGVSGDYDVDRRYSDFVELEERIRDAIPALPPLPPRSLFHKFFRSTEKSSFLLDRKKRLNEFIQAAVNFDPQLAIRDLRVFLACDRDLQLTRTSEIKWHTWLKPADEIAQYWRCNSTARVAGMFPVMSLGDFGKPAVKSGIAAKLQLAKWKRIKTLASAAAGDGTVDLMTRRDDTGRMVAVKKLPWRLIRSSPEDFMEKLPRAAEQPWTDIAVVRHLNSIRFPWTCELLDVFMGCTQVYIMTSFANGGDLFTWCQRDNSKATEARESTIRPLVVQIFTAVCWLHNLHIAHRDLSLENVMVHDCGKVNNHGQAEFEIKIIDFGMATVSRTAHEARGKRSYQAPEMHGSVGYDTFLADIFSVGVIAYCMAVHHYPWHNTKPEKDFAFQNAQLMGLEEFFRKKKLPKEERTVAEVFSRDFLEMLYGLLSFSPETRHCLGEDCFKNHLPDAGSCKSLATKDDATSISYISTADSMGSPRDAGLGEGEESDIDSKLDALRVQPWQPRKSIWDCHWLSPRDAPAGYMADDLTAGQSAGG